MAEHTLDFSHSEALFNVGCQLQLIAVNDGAIANRAAAVRSISTFYYAAFNALQFIIASRLVPQADTEGGRRAWEQAYRGVSHSSLQSAFDGLKKQNVEASNPALFIALNSLAALRAMREQADYFPSWRPDTQDLNNARGDSWSVIESAKMLEVEPDSISLLVAATLVKIRR